MAMRTALVTGAANGFGWETARKLAAAGHRVVLADRAEGVHARAETLRGEGRDAAAELLDVSDAAAIREVTERLIAQHGCIDILVNNAGMGTPRRGADGGVPAIHEMQDGDWAEVLAVNLTGPFLLSRAVVPGMRAGGWGRIVNISSRAGRTAVMAGDIAYAATKAGLVGMTRRLAAEVAADGVTVNAVAPGRFDTALARRSGEAVIAQALQGIPAARVGRPEEIAATVAFLCSEEAGYMTGTVIDVNGGAFMGG